MDPDYDDHVEAVKLLEAAEGHFSKGDYRACRENADGCVSLDPSLGRAWEVLGFLDLHDMDLYSAYGQFEMAITCNGQSEEARTAFELLESLGDLARVGPERAEEVLSELGTTLLKQRRYAPALCLHDGLMAVREDWRMLSSIGFMRRELGDLEGALEAYDRALGFEDAPPEILADLSVVMIKMGRLDEAEGALEECISAGVHLPNIMNNLGFVKEARGDLKGADNAYDRALEMDPTYFPAIYSKGRILQKLGREQEARTYMDRALDLEGRVYDLDDVTGREGRESGGGIHAKELMTPLRDED